MISDDGNGSISFKPFAGESDHIDEDYDIDIPTPASFLEVSLQQLKAKLDSTPHEMKSSLVYAQQVNTDLVNDEHLLGFLYVEKFNIDLALNRLLLYWTNRHKLFGDKYTQSLTLYGAMSDRVESIRKGFLILLPVLDEKGRAIIYSQPTLMGGEKEIVEETLQVWWYLIHVAMENPSVRKNGFIMLGNIKEMRLRHFNPKRVLAMLKSGEQYFPIRLQSLDLCNPMIIYPLVAPVVKAMLSLRLRQLLMVHRGTSERVLESLNACSLPDYCIPTNLGGNLDVSLEAFVRARLTIEGSGGAEDVDSISDDSGSMTRMFSIGSQSDMEAQSVHSSQASIASSIPQVSTAIKNTETRAEERKMKFKLHPGRHGDRRMNKAVKARQQDPKMSLIAALLHGGFIFPQLYTPGVKTSHVKDTEGVTVYQRKNQLNRRLREERNRKTKPEVGKAA